MRIAILALFVLISLASKSQITPADSSAIRSTVMSFYSWYTNHYTDLTGYKLYESIKTKDQPPYRINWQEVEKYFVTIRKTVPQLGEGFITQLRRHFTSADSAFKIETDSEIPYGFDYDWFTNSQEEPAYLLEELQKPARWIITIKGEDAYVTVPYTTTDPVLQKVPLFCAAMKKYKGVWKIDWVGCTDDEEN